ncbi:MAG: hypothetical protein ACKOXB_10095 [Flavobacteriales bacterium]
MKNIGKNIVYKEDKNELYIEIKPTYDKNKYNLALIWFIAWSFCGVMVVASWIFYDMNRDQKLFILVFMVFWAYFEYQVMQALRWRKSGLEKVKITNGKMHYVKEISGRGLEKIYDTHTLSNLFYQADANEGFFNILNQSNWMPGNEVLEFKAADKKRRIGIQLNKNDAELLANKINSYIQKNNLKTT